MKAAVAACQQQQSKFGQHAGSFDVASKQKDKMCHNAGDSHKLDREQRPQIQKLEKDLQPKEDEQRQIKQQW